MKRWLIYWLSRLDDWGLLMPLVLVIVIALLLIVLEIATRTRPLHLTWK